MPALLGLVFSRGGLIVGACLLLAGVFGVQELRLAHAHAVAERAQAAAARADVARHQAAAQSVSTDVGSKLAAERVRIEYRTRTLIQKVQTYVPQAADDRCIVNRGFVLQHDLAARPDAAIPAAAAGGGPVEAPSGVALSAVAETVTANYGTAYAWRAEALAWREWYVRQKAEWEKR